MKKSITHLKKIFDLIKKSLFLKNKKKNLKEDEIIKTHQCLRHQ